MTWPTEQARRDATDSCEHEGLHKACATCAPIIAATVAALSPHVAALVRAERAAALRDAADVLEVLVDDQHPAAANPDQWLRDRADAEEAGR